MFHLFYLLKRPSWPSRVFIVGEFAYCDLLILWLLVWVLSLSHSSLFRHRRIRFPLLLPGLSQSPRHIRPPLGDPSQQVLPTWNNTIFIAKWTLKVGTKPHFCDQSLSPKFDVATSEHPYKCGAVVRSETSTWPFRKAMICIDLQQPNCWTFCRALQLSTVGTRMLDCAAKMMSTYRFLTEKISWSENLASISSVCFVGLLPARFKPPTPRFLMTKGEVQTSELHIGKHV